MINLRFRKDVHIPDGVLKRIIEFISTQEETQVKEELQHHTFQPTGVNSQVTTSAEDVIQHLLVMLLQHQPHQTRTWQKRSSLYSLLQHNNLDIHHPFHKDSKSKSKTTN